MTRALSSATKMHSRQIAYSEMKISLTVYITFHVVTKKRRSSHNSRATPHKYAPKFPDEPLALKFTALAFFNQDFRKAASVTLRGILGQEKSHHTRRKHSLAELTSFAADNGLTT